MAKQVTVKIKRIENRRIMDSLLTQMQGWTRDTYHEILPTVPYKTGELRASGGHKTYADAYQNIHNDIFFKAPYAGILEHSDPPMTPHFPGTRIPYAWPGLLQRVFTGGKEGGQLRQELKDAIRRGFDGVKGLR